MSLNLGKQNVLLNVLLNNLLVSAILNLQLTMSRGMAEISSKNLELSWAVRKYCDSAAQWRAGKGTKELPQICHWPGGHPRRKVTPWGGHLKPLAYTYTACIIKAIIETLFLCKSSMTQMISWLKLKRRLVCTPANALTLGISAGAIMWSVYVQSEPSHLLATWRL